MDDPVADLWSTVQAWDDAAWCLAALALAHGSDVAPALRHDAREVLDVAGLGAEAPSGTAPPLLAGRAATPLFEIAHLLSGGTAWSQQPDAALLAVGDQSAVMPGFLARNALPLMPGLAERLGAGDARVLDVGTGVGGMARAFARTFPRVSVVGIDVLDRPLDLARRRLAETTEADRVELRRQSVADLDDEQAYDLAWLPAPFLPEGALRAGTPRVVRALRPGGWVVLGHSKVAGHPVRQALARLRIGACGGTLLDEEAAAALLTAAGLEAVAALTTPASAPALTIGRRPG